MATLVTKLIRVREKTPKPAVKSKTTEKAIMNFVRIETLENKNMCGLPTIVCCISGKARVARRFHSIGCNLVKLIYLIGRGTRYFIRIGRQRAMTSLFILLILSQARLA
ncbi:hypothetical protein [Acidocella sp.]|uniref:hypothetical protein n=1 Tax=Acidocella sp. TaxID=50710 RepID=UPI00261BD303|nr:hypothetical protein [Acidocella sp.]